MQTDNSLNDILNRLENLLNKNKFNTSNSFFTSLVEENKKITDEKIKEILLYYKINKFEIVEELLNIVGYPMPFLEANTRNRVKLNTLMEIVFYYIVNSDAEEQSKKYSALRDFILDVVKKQENVKRDEIIRFILELGVYKDLSLAEGLYKIFGYCLDYSDWYDGALGIFIDDGYEKICCLSAEGTRIPYPIGNKGEEIYDDEKNDDYLISNQRKYERILNNIIVEDQFETRIDTLSDKMNPLYESLKEVFKKLIEGKDNDSVDYSDFMEKCLTNNNKKIAKYLYGYLKSNNIQLDEYNIDEKMIYQAVENSSNDPLEILANVEKELTQKANQEQIINDITLLLYVISSKRDEITRADEYSKMYEKFYPWESRTEESDDWLDINENLSTELVNYVVFIYLFSFKDLEKRGNGFRSIMDNIDKSSVAGCMKKIFLQKLWVNKVDKYDYIATKITENFPTEESFTENFSSIIKNIMDEIKEETIYDEKLKNYYNYHIKKLPVLSQTTEQITEKLSEIYKDIYNEKQKKSSTKKLKKIEGGE